MPVQKSPLEQLIEFPKCGDSTQRRELMRLCTDRLLAAPDRYGIREMEFFDLLFSNTARRMDHHTRRLIVATLSKAGLSRETISTLIMKPSSMLGQILRRSATQSMPDLVEMIRSKTRSHFGPEALGGPAGDIHLPEHRFTLPNVLLQEMFRFIWLSIAREALAINGGKLAGLLRHSITQNGQKVIDDSVTEARDAVLEARTAVQKRIRINKLNEDFLAELIDTGQNLQFTLALTHKLEVDTTTMLRLFNDATWESLALACRSVRLSRHCFSRIINSMHKREDDNPNALRIMGLYDKIPQESADRVMRFWQVRVSALKEMTYDDDVAPLATPANCDDDAPSGGKRAFGRA